ncbi:collagen-like protein [Patescibacteria group bacterium]
MKKVMITGLVVICALFITTTSVKGLQLVAETLDLETVWNNEVVLRGGNPFTALWQALANLQEQIDNIQLIPGPEGPQGPQGETGPQGPAGEGWDEERFVALEARVEYLESLHASIPPNVILWDNYHPTTDLTTGEILNIKDYSNAQLEFDWQGTPAGHTCQYAYTYYDNNQVETYYSTFLYLDGGCQGTANISIPEDVVFMRIDAWTPAWGTLNGVLHLFE